MKTPEDEEFESIEKLQNWRSLQGADSKGYESINYRDAFPREKYVFPVDRNEVLEEVAKEFDKMRSLGDTAASFAVFVRNMKR